VKILGFGKKLFTTLQPDPSSVGKIFRFFVGESGVS